MTYLQEGDGPDIRPNEHVNRIPLIVTLFHGRPKVSFLAICISCGGPGSRPVPIPFATEAARDRWAEGHASTGHEIKYALEVRPT